MQEQPAPQQQRPGFSKFWWIVLGFLVLWNIWLALPTGMPQATIPYSTFLDQVTANNVTVVQISGDQITGQFTKAFTWPPVAATPSASSTPQSSTAAAASTASTNSQTYMLFNTTFPSTVGDPTLLPLLENHNVEVDVTPPATPW